LKSYIAFSFLKLLDASMKSLSHPISSSKYLKTYMSLSRKQLSMLMLLRSYVKMG